MILWRGRLLWLIFLGTICFCLNACRSERKPDAPAKRAVAEPVPEPKRSPATPAPISWTEVASAYERVADYVCLYLKIERAISKGEEQKIRLSFRKPFDVRMDWLEKQDHLTQTAVYRQGFNDGKVLARDNGFLGSIAGTLRLDPNESLALSDSRHPITEVGIGKIIERAQHDAANPRIASHFDSEELLNGKPAYKFEFLATGNEAVGGTADARKALLWIDRELKLPVRLELYDSANVLLERHSFAAMRINQHLADKNFGL